MENHSTFMEIAAWLFIVLMLIHAIIWVSAVVLKFKDEETTQTFANGISIGMIGLFVAGFGVDKNHHILYAIMVQMISLYLTLIITLLIGFYALKLWNWGMDKIKKRNGNFWPIQ